MNKFCFGAIYNGRLWEKELGVVAGLCNYRALGSALIAQFSKNTRTSFEK